MDIVYTTKSKRQLNTYMKRFKKFLREETQLSTGTNTGTSGTDKPEKPTGFDPVWVPYKLPETPDSKYPGTSTPPGQDIDWTEIDEIFQKILEALQRQHNNDPSYILQLIQKLRLLGFTIPVHWLLEPNPATFESDLLRWFYETYPNATEQQRDTFLFRIKDLIDKFNYIQNPITPGHPGSPLQGWNNEPRYWRGYYDGEIIVFPPWDPRTYYPSPVVISPPQHPFRPPPPPDPPIWETPQQEIRDRVPQWIREYTPYPHRLPSNPYPGTYEA
jgi:hypothetical protein